jgi:C-terminal processing protease CtpA/Prc
MQCRIESCLASLLLCCISVIPVPRYAAEAPDKAGVVEHATPDVLQAICDDMDVWHVTPVNWPTVMGAGFDKAAATASGKAGEALREAAADARKALASYATPDWRQWNISEVTRINRTMAHLPEGTLEKAFADGMIAAADPQRGVIWPSEIVEFKNDAAKPADIGVELRSVGQKDVGVYPREISPASDSGVLYGETLTAIDGQPVNSLADGARRLKGQPGSVVRLTLHAPDGKTVRSVNIVRDLVKTRVIRGLDGLDPSERFILPETTGIAYIQIASFTKEVDQGLGDALRRAALVAQRS